jgi:hypothetical protein
MRSGHLPITLAAILAAFAVSVFAADDRPPNSQRQSITLFVGAESMTQLPSQWPEYFGTHYAGTPEGVGKWWNTVRSYGGTHTGIYATDDSPQHEGPFTGRTVRVGLSDFHSRFNRSGRSADQLIADLIEHRFTAIYQMTTIVRPSLEPFDKDLAYWTVYQIHKEFPKAWKHVAWQIGNEVVSGHFDPKGQRQETGVLEEAKQGQFHGYDLDWKEDYYVEDYLAPAIEAIERASNDVYGDPRKIKILLGSMNPYNRQNIEFLKNVMGRTFTGKNAPTLTGEPVWKHIDVLTVHYMFGGVRTVQRMQGYVDDYLRTGKLDGIWMTEDHGRAGKGPVTVIERGFRFMAWVARNKLDAKQARLVWWGDGARKPGGSARDAEQLLGDFLCGRTLFFLSRSGDVGHIYVISDGVGSKTSRILVALVPNRDSEFLLEDVRLGLPEDIPHSGWSADAIQFSATELPAKTVAPVDSEETELRISIGKPVTEPMLLLLRQPETEGTSR